MQVIQTVGIIYLLFVKFHKGVTSRIWLYVHAGITVTIFVVIPIINLIRICVFLARNHFIVFCYWFLFYLVMGVGMIAVLLLPIFFCIIITSELRSGKITA